MKLTPRTVLIVCAAAILLVPHATSAQTPERSSSPDTLLIAQANQPQNVPAAARNAEDSIERTARRFGIGVEGGVSLDPELIDIGAHATFGPIFRPNVQFRPGIEFGFGELTTLFAINLDVLYTLPGTTRQTRWMPYVGAGPNFTLSHRGFSTPTDGDGNVDDGSRFDFGDTKFSNGFNFIAGARNQRGVSLEMKATAWGVSNVRLLAGFRF